MKDGPSLHGFAVRAGGEVELRFGIAAFLGYIWTSQLALLNHVPTPWPFRRIDQRLTHLQLAACHLTFKLERAASLYAWTARECGAAVLTNDVAPRDEDLAEANVVLCRIAGGLAAFLDAYVFHFNERIQTAAGWAPLSRGDGSGCKVLDFASLPESAWLLPVIAPAG